MVLPHTITKLSYLISPGTPGMPKNFRNTTRYQHGKRRFEYADLNRDGHLTMHEFLYFLNPEEGKHMRKCIVLVSFVFVLFLQVKHVCMQVR
jgi:hypothetical protein